MDIYVAKQENYKTHMHTIMKVYIYIATVDIIYVILQVSII